MKVAIRYYTKSGNTKKLADAISSAVGVPAETVASPLTEKVDVLFLGSSVYAAGVAEAVKKFIAENKEQIGQIVNFSTAALIPSTYNQVKKLAESNQIPISEKEFHCKGSFAMVHKGKPDAKDLEDVAVFAKDIVKE
jgi:flavodoxin